jgi:hypothetical protein
LNVFFSVGSEKLTEKNKNKIEQNSEKVLYVL